MCLDMAGWGAVRPGMRYPLPLILAALVLACAESTPPPSSTTLHQRALELSVPEDYPTIQAAIDAAGEGDVVVLTEATYNEGFSLAAGVIIRGQGPGATVIYGQVTAAGATAALEELTLDGSLSGAPATHGLTTSAASASYVNVEVRNFTGDGVRIDGATEVVSLTGVHVHHNGGRGIAVNSDDGAAVTNSILAFNGDSGLHVANAASLQASNTLALANGHATQTAGVRFDAGAGGALTNSIVTGNHLGLSCGTACQGGHNIVWGNGTDYADGAAALSGDITSDPRLVSPSEGNYRLRPDSPAIDAGTSTDAPTTDFDGTARPAGLGFDIGPFEFGGSPGAVTLVITEVMSNPLDEAVGEYIELYNPGATPVDAAGLVIDDGDAAEPLVPFQGGPTIIAAGGYGVIVDPTHLPGFYYDVPAGVPMLTTPDLTIGTGLTNNDPITLWTADDIPVSTYSYPFNAGNGISVEMDSLDDGDIASNWVASPCAGSPGLPNCASAPPAPGASFDVVITEVMANPLDEATGEFVELLNRGLGSVELAGWLIDDGDSSDVLGPFNGGSTVLGPGKYAVIVDPDYAGQYAIASDAIVVTTTASATLGNGLSTNDPITITEEDGTELDAWNAPFDPGNGTSAERLDPAADTFAVSSCASGSSPGQGACDDGGGPAPGDAVALVISEVMANALDEDTGEFVEIYNAGPDPVDLAGYRIDDGDKDEVLQAYQGGSTLLASGEYAVILDAEYADDYAIPAGTVLLTTFNTTIGSGLSTNDPIVLRAPNRTAALSTFAFPFNPGNGVSAERQDLTGPDQPGNWSASTCGASPGQVNCSGSAPPPTSAPLVAVGLVISEVMANPINEGTSEYVELYNGGSTPIDLLDYRIDDGDGSDTLVGFGGGGTVLQPGQYGVVLDPDYADAYSIPAVALLLTVSNGAIGNGLSTTDPITLSTPDGPGSMVIATFSFPSNPGNGKSLEALTLSAGDALSNWGTSSCQLSSGDANNHASPGAANCASPAQSPGGNRQIGQPCPSGGADCASGLCAVNTVSGNAVCTADCASSGCPLGSACATSADPAFPSLCVSDGSGPPTLPPVIINELVYDGPGSDVDVFVELAGPAGTVLDGLALVGVNGSNGNTYNTIPLSGAIGGDGYFVVAHPSANAAIVAAADMLTTKADYQNSPDSVQLTFDGQVVDAVAYGGFSASETLAGEGGAAADQAAGQSLARIPDQSDTDDNATDFALSEPTPGAANGAPPTVVPTPSKLLISEVVISPTAAEMVEIYNPGGASVDLSNVWIADYHQYHGVTTGTGLPSSADFRMKFPDGASIAPGGYVTVSLETEAHFDAVYGVWPDFDLAEGGVAPKMGGDYTGSASLSNSQEALTLFFWDGASELVVDLDYIVWGGTVPGTYKTNVTVGGSSYLPDTPLASQDAIATPGTASINRCDLSEGAQTSSGGNGFGGSDETSEDLSNTFQLLADVTPNAAGNCAAPCVPDCSGKTCGDDGCGGSCGSCAGGLICEVDQCITPAGPLALTQVTGFEQPEALADVDELVLFTSAAEFQSHFGVAPPASIDFSTHWAMYYSAGRRNLAGFDARITEVVDNTNELFVFYELQVPGEGCSVFDYTVPTWTLVSFPQPSSGATALTPIFGEDDFDCTTGGAGDYDTCNSKTLCADGRICAGITFGNGFCSPAWMRQTYDFTAATPIPDDASELWTTLPVTGLASVAMDVIVWVEIAHPYPSQLTVSLLPPPSYEGEYNYEGFLHDQQATSGPDLSIHTATFFFPGDETVNGVWSLKVVDHVAGTTGTLTAWGLEISSRWD